MSLLLDALRRLETAPQVKSTAASPRGVSGTPPANPPRAVRVEESPPSRVEPVPPADPRVVPASDDSTAGERQAAGKTPGIESARSTLENATPPAPAPPTWDAAYRPDPCSAAPSSAWEAPAQVVTTPEQSVRPLTTTVDAPLDGHAAVERPIVSQEAISPSEVVVIPPEPSAFDCRSLAAAVHRLRPAGGRLALVSIGHETSIAGVPDWSADLAGELAETSALPVERCAAGRLSLDGEEAGPPVPRGYRLYFLDAEFATGRGALLRTLDAVLLVVYQRATSVKAAEVVRCALAAQNVEFAGFAYVAD